MNTVRQGIVMFALLFWMNTMVRQNVGGLILEIGVGGMLYLLMSALYLIFVNRDTSAYLRQRICRKRNC